LLKAKNLAFGIGFSQIDTYNFLHAFYCKRTMYNINFINPVAQIAFMQGINQKQTYFAPAIGITFLHLDLLYTYGIALNKTNS
jgi:hypothetical protein